MFLSEREGRNSRAAASISSIVMSDRKLVVLGVPWDVDTEGLREYMSKFWELEDCVVMKATDRAHRLGQRKVVNVHRLIMRDTMEEKVMSLQKLKVSVANAVINAENSSMNTMNTDQLLDLFTSAEGKKGARTSTSSNGVNTDAKLPGRGKGLKAILGGLEELWDQSQYTEEYDLSQFLTKLNGCSMQSTRKCFRDFGFEDAI